jgi:hypothetical protein
MNAVSLVPPEEWKEALRDYGCKPLEGKGPLNTAEWWQMPWGGYPFIVPVDTTKDGATGGHLIA